MSCHYTFGAVAFISLGNLETASPIISNSLITEDYLILIGEEVEINVIGIRENRFRRVYYI